MQTASSANCTCGARRSASENTATGLMPISFAERMIRNAISPRLAIKSFSIIRLKLLLFLMMPRKLILPLIAMLFLLLPFAGLGQTENNAEQARARELQELMNRRTELIRQWRRFNLEENALFGGKSKKDLRNI